MLRRVLNLIDAVLGLEEEYLWKLHESSDGRKGDDGGLEIGSRWLQNQYPNLNSRMLRGNRFMELIRPRFSISISTVSLPERNNRGIF